MNPTLPLHTESDPETSKKFTKGGVNNNQNITPEIIRTWKMTKLNKLADDIRERIIEIVGKRGGHLAPSLGVVELTIALHYVFDTPRDKIIWDVGHQSYAHKLITGRWHEFETLRSAGGIAGFPKRKESEYDVFDTGHSGNSISVALGLATAANLKKENLKVIAVIGDGSIVTGMAFEAINNAGASKENLLVVLNDNEMAIGKSAGAMAKYLSRMITGKTYNRFKSDTWNLLGILPKNLSGRARIAAKKIEEGLKNLVAPSVIFEEMGFRYIGPFDGHDLLALIENFQKIKSMQGPTLIHVVTKKGKGYEPAEKQPEVYHGIGPFALKKPNSKNNSLTTSDVFGNALIEIAEKDNRICGISAGMCLGTGLIEFKRKFPNRFFDVGICEQHAVTFSAGLALTGLKPVVAIYSTFLARAYDQIIQDIALQNLPVVFAIDRAGIVGEDGPTHHGNFDLSYLRTIPNMTIAVPKDSSELVAMLKFALAYNHPFALRYPKGNLNCTEMPNSGSPIEIGKAEIVYEFSTNEKQLKKMLCIFAIGSMVIPSYQALKLLENESIGNYQIKLINMRFVKPLDEKLLIQLVKNTDVVITVEENTLVGGFGSAVMESLQKISNLHFPISNLIRLGLEDTFIEQGTRENLLDQYGLSPLKLKDKFNEAIKQLQD
jgi:1-deoxy-D-xylulose-5-phosphate synthase